ncbi:hypothetical protein IKF02_00280 [Candidatus Saccharibacteria bacterium]|nr:hypothetical protein [Candidatus Saccharibacteria bacterium]MBR3144253.1 hypothetical protein [Candidatus Saccharibacteria bacterium]
MKERGEKKKKFERNICIFGYILVPVFFVILYLLMTKTYEDISMGNARSDSSVFGILNHVYHYIPRLGEFYQQTAARFMTEQVSFGPDLLFRLASSAAASGVVYFSTAFVLGRRLKLRYMDVLIYLGIMLFIMVSIFSEAFTYRFSFANNYALALLASILFLLLFRVEVMENKWWKDIGAIIIGFAFGISTEIVPVAFLIIMAIWILAKIMKKELKFGDFWAKYKIQFFAIIGLFAGLLFFYSGAGLGGRTSGGYAEIYDYVALGDLFRNPLDTVYKLVHHVWYNIRYVFFAIPLMCMYIFVEVSLFKGDRKKYLFWQILLFSFCLLFVGATSLVKVHDDLYARFMIPMFMAIVLSTMLFVRHIMEYSKISDKALRAATLVEVVLVVVLVADMTFAFALYNRTVAPMLNAIKYNPGGELQIDSIEGDYTMIPSPVFNLKQLPPFDWGPSADYVKFGL